MAKYNSVLLIEDDSITIMVCDRIMKMYAFSSHVISKTNGHDALLYLQELTQKNEPIPEIIFLDINMPVMNGWDFLQEFELLKIDSNKVPHVFILSSTVDPEDAKRALSFTCVKGSLSKPLTKQHLEQIG
jgi:CheY-like chemotaxis protein